MPSVGFEPTIAAGERPQTYALDRADTGTGYIAVSSSNYITSNDKMTNEIKNHQIYYRRRYAGHPKAETCQQSTNIHLRKEPAAGLRGS
jgi:hypothetical protein